MSEHILALSPAKYYEEAELMLERKDSLDFMSKITTAIVLAGNDKEMLAKATFFQAEGLFLLKQHKKALEYIDEALKFNSGEKATRLKNYKGVIYGYLGEAKKAENVLLEVLTETQEHVFLTEVYLNLVWVYLTVDKQRNLQEAKKYLDLGQNNFDLLPNSLKRKILNNYSVYYFYQSDYEKAIEVLNKAFNYAEEKDLPKLYNNLAEIELKHTEEEGSNSVSIKEYLDKAEVIASKYEDKIEMAFSFYTRAMVELQEDQLFSALDTLYLAFDYYTDAEAYTYSLECLLKINELVSNYKTECMRTMQQKLRNKVEGNPLYEKVLTT